MALPSTGPLSFNQVNTELGRPATQLITLNDPAVRSLAGIPSGTIAFSDLRGKAASGSIDNSSPSSWVELTAPIDSPIRTWNNPANTAIQADTTYSYYVINNVSSGTDHPTTDILVSRGFGFAVPAGKTITNLKVEFRLGHAVGGSPLIKLNFVKLYNNTTQIGLDKTTYPVINSGFSTFTFQGNSSYWGTTLNDVVVNNSLFGIGFYTHNYDGNKNDDGEVRCAWVRMSVSW